MRLATATDFEGGALYSNYHRYPFFADRADSLVARYGTTGKWLIGGCGWGFLVDELITRGVDAWGVDASSYCLTKAVANLVSGRASKILQADITSRTSLATAKTATGLSGSTKFRIMVTEDVLPVLTDAEITSALTECRRIATNVFHICTPGDPADPAKNPVLNWKSASAWKTLVAPDLFMNAETGLVV